MLGILVYLVAAVLILFFYVLVFPTQDFFYQLIGALIVSLLVWDMTTKRYLLKISRIFAIQWERQTEQFFCAPSETKLTKLKLFRRKRNDEITPVYIEKLSVKSSAAMIVTLQGEKNVKQAATLGFQHFKVLAQKAAKWQAYRQYLLREATVDFPLIHKIADTLAPPSEYVTGDDLKLTSDNDFLKRLATTSKEVVHIFTTTSQLSSDFITTVANHKKDIKTLHFYICSPYIQSHKSLLDLTQEYENPAFTRQKGQFVCNDDDSVHVEADMVRRMIKILGAIRELARLTNQVNIELHFFTQRYPGVKIKALEQKGYAQIQPGPLSYANNLYRFAVDVKESEHNQLLQKDLAAFRQSGKIETIELKASSGKPVGEQAVKEMCQWLCSRGMTEKKLQAMHSRIKDIAKDADSDKIINDIFLRLEKVTDVLAQGDQVCEVLAPDGSVTHFSTGLIIEKDDKLLLIKKADPFYKEKYSIVAGHVNRHETPVEAIKREVYEELGLTLSNPRLITPAFELNDACRHNADRHLWFVFKADLPDGDYQLDSSEISKTKLVPIADLKADLLTPGALGVMKKLSYMP
ncbi:NUDIX hydrolase [Pseudomonas sp. M20]|jgi:ADP-ribose pyrophosphatase YjhB (NUDIX family)|uniref:NUDIX hydrolase n=1 Tax=Pseudomonas sp. M20 TaxID=3379129 RepID=UPI00386DC3D0